MVVQRAAGGNTTYFLGEVSNIGSRSYFPLVYLIKETLTLHILTLIALTLSIIGFLKNKLFRPLKLKIFLQNHIAELLMIAFIVLYWFSSVRSPLNIGVRHVLPTFPFVFTLVAGQIVLWLKNKNNDTNLSLDKIIRNFFQAFRAKTIKFFLIGILISWQLVSVISIYPYFLAYFNELAGGAKNGYLIVTDSNLDWGQDLKRLARWTEQNNIEKIYVDYFGGAVADYYLGDKFMPWWGSRSPQDLNNTGGYLAVSATFLQGGRGEPAPGFKEATGYYRWLNNFQPVATIGYSIFVYYIPPNSL